MAAEHRQRAEHADLGTAGAQLGAGRRDRRAGVDRVVDHRERTAGELRSQRRRDAVARGALLGTSGPTSRESPRRRAHDVTARPGSRPITVYMTDVSPSPIWNIPV